MSMSKQEYISYWIETALDNIDTAKYLFSGKKYVEALFFTHLYLEKICKALWVQNNEQNHPPRIHNLVRLLEKSLIQLPEEDLEFLDVMNAYQIEGRYPDYMNMLHKDTNKEIAEEYIKKAKQIGECLRRKLQ